MAFQTPILKKTFRSEAGSYTTPPGGAAAINLAWVCSTTYPGTVKAPTAANVPGFIGVNTGPSDVLDPENAMELVVAGIAQIQSDGSATMAPGDLVAIANTTGQVKTVTITLGTTHLYEIIGTCLTTVAATAGLLADVLLKPSLYGST